MSRADIARTMAIRARLLSRGTTATDWGPDRLLVPDIAPENPKRKATRKRRKKAGTEET